MTNPTLYQPSYRTFRMDLATPRSAPGEQIVGIGQRVAAIIPHVTPIGANCNIRFGANGDDMPLEFTPSLEICPGAGNGLYFNNPAGAGVAIFTVAFEDQATGGSVQGS